MYCRLKLYKTRKTVHTALYTINNVLRKREQSQNRIEYTMLKMSIQDSSQLYKRGSWQYHQKKSLWDRHNCHQITKRSPHKCRILLDWYKSHITVDKSSRKVYQLLNSIYQHIAYTLNCCTGRTGDMKQSIVRTWLRNQ